MAEIDVDAELRKDVIALGIHMEIITKAVQRLEEANEGTLRTRGFKERLAIAEDNIQSNKDSFQKLDEHIAAVEKRFNETLREAFTELTGKIKEVAQEGQTQKTLLQKWQPYMNVIIWLGAGAGSILLAQFLSGKWTFTP